MSSREFAVESICTFGNPTFTPPNAFLLFPYVNVAGPLQDGSPAIEEVDNCTLLNIKSIPIAGCLDHPAQSPETIFCVIDCEDTPTTVLPEATSNPGTPYTPVNKQTQPYDPTSTTIETDITVEFPAAALEGEIIAVVNNTNSDKPITVDGNGNNVQSMQAPFTTATTVIRGARLSIMYQLRVNNGAGTPMEWRIF